jgi:dTDP-L-rhamnose 4-epimerase
MAKHLLITGGAGFIGSHLAEELLRHGNRVRILDNLSVQVHGEQCKSPAYLNPEAELIRGDIRDPVALTRALKGVDAVFHLGAAVGVGQSMYQIADYTSVNNLGTAMLLEALSRQPVERLIVASSMSIYGEGLYQAPDGTLRERVDRSLARLRAKQWEPCDPDGAPLTPIPTPETKNPCIASVYALSKFDQERMCLMIGNAYNVPTVALRFFNVFGPYQALSNPYTGVLTNFAARLLNGNAPVIFEDGLQLRDFISVYDVARACRLALEAPEAPGRVFNIGSGQSHTIIEVALRVAAVLGRDAIRPRILGQYRAGDIRHCYADVSLARKFLGFEARVGLDEGIESMAEWLEGQFVEDRSPIATRELAARGLVI